MDKAISTIDKKERNRQIAIRFFLDKRTQSDIAKEYGLDQSMIHHVVKSYKQDKRFRDEFISEADVKLALAAPQAADKLIDTSKHGDNERLALDATKAILARNINLGGEKVQQTIHIGQIQALIGASLGYEQADKQVNGRSLQGDDKGDVIDIEEESA